MHQSLYNEFWEKQASISSTSQLVSESHYEAQEIRNNITNENSNNQVRIQFIVQHCLNDMIFDIEPFNV